MMPIQRGIFHIKSNLNGNSFISMEKLSQAFPFSHTLSSTLLSLSYTTFICSNMALRMLVINRNCIITAISLVVYAKWLFCEKKVAE